MNLDLLNFVFGSLVTAVGIIASYFVFKTKTESRLGNIEKNQENLDARMLHHDEEDKKMKNDLTALIDRNKTINEAFNQTIQAKLESIGNQIVEVKTIVKYKLNEG